MKILIVEDEPSLREIIADALAAERYVVETADCFVRAGEKMALYDYDCILLDLMLPDGDGLELLKLIRERHKQDCVIIISAKDSVDDRVAGLEFGADDYLPKPFHMSELHARIRSVLRRRRSDGRPTVDFGNVSVNPDTHTVSVAGAAVEFSRKEYDLLNFFIDRRGHMLKKEQIAEGVWGDYIDQCDNFDFIYAQIRNLRRKLEEAGADVEIKSVYGFGYRMIRKQEP